MNRPRTTVFLLVLAALSAAAWLWTSSQPSYGYALIQAYGLVAGTPATVSGSDGATLAVLIAARPLMWLFLGCAACAAFAPGRRALLAALLVLIALVLVCIAMPQAVGITLLGLGDATLLGGMAFLLPGALATAVQRITGAREI